MCLQAECCEDHVHCCPADTTCDSSTSSCVNSTVSVPWAERTSADHPSASKVRATPFVFPPEPILNPSKCPCRRALQSYRMIRTSMDEDSENTCPDLSRCPAEFSCLKASTKFGCCPVAKVSEPAFQRFIIRTEEIRITETKMFLTLI